MSTLLLNRPRLPAEQPWNLHFAGRAVRVPLDDASTCDVYWDFALALTGHDIEIKRLYEQMLGSDTPPRVFFDIGTNFGTHSVPFLVHGVRTISFEPNPACHEVFKTVCAANHVRPTLCPLAVGSQEERVVLTFPPGETWLGTVLPDVTRDLEIGHAMDSILVEQTTVDAFVAAGGPLPDLIKIDTEGNEVAVLEGARKTIETASPLIIFESFAGPSRTQLLDSLGERGYQVLSLSSRKPLTGDEFATSRETNHVALRDGSLHAATVAALPSTQILRF